MENKRVVPIWVSVVLLVLLVVGIIADIVDMILYSHLAPYSFALKSVNCLACIAALLYCLKGYSKDAASFFGSFCIIYCISCLLPLYWVAKTYQGGDITSILNLTFHLLPFACMSIFAVARDIGKVKSLTLAGIVLVCTLITLLLAIQLPFYYWLSLLVNLILTIVFLIMVYAKYADKTARGTK